MLKDVKSSELFLNQLHLQNKEKNNVAYLLSNMRMTICELG